MLALIGLASPFAIWHPFRATEAVGVWRSVHGLAMMIGAGAVLIGFLAGVMYLRAIAATEAQTGRFNVSVADPGIAGPDESSSVW